MLQAYPDHLDLFKGSFTLIERLTESLRGELNRAAPALSEYRNLSGKLSKLHSFNEEIEAIEGDISNNVASGPDPGGAEAGEEQRISEEISAKQGELAEIGRESSLLHQSITRLTGPAGTPLEEVRPHSAEEEGAKCLHKGTFREPRLRIGLQQLQRADE